MSHFTTDLSSGYLPVGPDLNSGRSGAQYFTFAFRRTAMANFTVRLSGKVSGFFIAAPATGIDAASSLNGWIDAGITYGGAGTPGANTGAGGNGSNGCAFTSGDRIIDGSTYSNDTFTLTLGDQNGTNSFGNQILVRFAPNEAVVSEFIIKTSQIWTNSGDIPGVIPASNSSIVALYTDATGSSLETTEDGTASDNRTWKTGLTNWIPPGFGATYQLKVYAAATGLANAQSAGTQLFETGSGSDDQWYFDYQSGILNFIGSNLPSAIGTSSGNVIYVAGAVYVGNTGVTSTGNHDSWR